MDFSKFYEELQKEKLNLAQMDEGYAEIMNDEMFQDCPAWVNNFFHVYERVQDANQTDMRRVNKTNVVHRQS